MGALDQILQMQFAYLWLPVIVFVVVVATIYWITRPAPQMVQETTDETTFAIQPAQSKDQRHGFRRHGNPVEIYIAAPEDKSTPDLGSVLDRSVGGVRLALYHKDEIGKVLSIRPINADAIVPWVDIEIRSCRPSSDMPGQFDVGCQYVKSPPYSIQLLFG